MDDLEIMNEDQKIEPTDESSAEDKVQEAEAHEEDGKRSKKHANHKGKEYKKIKELEEKIHGLEKDHLQLRDQYLRKLAEFENYKRRTEKEFLAHLEYANEGLIVDLLPVIDDFERFLNHADKSENQQTLREGIDLIYKKMMSVLEKKGLKIMVSVGQEFDAEKHQALMQMESDKYESGYILDEHVKGYTLGNKVIRHAQVLVVK